MITSGQLRNLNIDDFSILYMKAKVNSEIETIMCLIFQEQYIKHNNILVYPMDHLSESYHIALLNQLMTRLAVSSIYIHRKNLYIDWSLDK